MIGTVPAGGRADRPPALSARFGVVHRSAAGRAPFGRTPRQLSEYLRRHALHPERPVPDGDWPDQVTAICSQLRDTMLAYRDFAKVERRIAASYDASRAYLAEHLR